MNDTTTSATTLN